MDQSNRMRQTSKVLVLLIVLTFAALIYQIISSFHVLQTTGKLIVNVSDKNAVIAISQPNKAAASLGIGAVMARLQPGTYLLSASEAGKSASKVIEVGVGKTLTVDLTLSDQSVIASAANIHFIGLSQLTQNGLTDTQVTNLEELFFNYNNSAKEIVVDQSSITLEPHDPKGNDPSFVIDFAVTIDGARYSAMARYENLSDVQLTLTDSTSGVQKFSQNSTVLSPSANGD